MKARKSSGGMFAAAKARPEKADVIDSLVENHGVSLKSARKIAKHVTMDRLREVEAMDATTLKDLLSGSTLEIKKATDETEANKAFIESTEVIKTLKSGLRETTEPYRASILLASNLLEEKNAAKE